MFALKMIARRQIPDMNEKRDVCHSSRSSWTYDATVEKRVAASVDRAASSAGRYEVLVPASPQKGKHVE